MSVKKERFDSAELYTIENKSGAKVKITNVGASIVSLLVPDKNGVLRDVVLGYASGDDYYKPGPNHGAVCGRVANRIEDARFTLNGRTYVLEPNYNGSHVLHGGKEPLSHREFSLADEGENFITLAVRLPDGENGFPGNMDIRVTYTFTDDAALTLHYVAVCDTDTVINLTNHAYFNLRGHASGNVADHVMQIFGDTYAPLRENYMVYGEIAPVPPIFDFRKPKPLGQDIDADCEQMHITHGYDHAWTIQESDKALAPAARVYCPESGISLEVNTDSPTILLYTGNNLPGVDYPAKDGAKYERRGAFCLETGFYPNALRFPEFGQGFLAANETFDYTTEFRFGIEK